MYRLIFYLLVFLSGEAFAQSNITDTLAFPRTITISYFGNLLVKPGVKVGIEFVIAHKTKVKKKNYKKSIRQLTVSGNLGTFWHPHSHASLFNFYTANYRIVEINKRKFNMIGIGPGIYRSFYPETYKVDDSGNVSSLSMAGRLYFAPVIVLGVGKFKENKTIQSWHFNTNFMFLFDYNTGVVPLLSFDIGLAISFKRKYKD